MVSSYGAAMGKKWQGVAARASLQQSRMVSLRLRGAASGPRPHARPSIQRRHSRLHLPHHIRNGIHHELRLVHLNHGAGVMRDDLATIP